MIKVSEVIGLTTALSVLLSIAYVMGMSMAVQIPLLPLMTIENVVMTSMQMIVVALIIAGFHFTRVETAKAKAERQESDEPIKKFNRAGYFFLPFLIFTIISSFLSRSYPAGILNTIILIYIIFARKNSDRYYSYMQKFVPPQTAYLLLLLPMMLMLTSFMGYSYGKSGFSIFTWKTLAIEAQPNENEDGKYYGKLLCSLGEKYLILRYDGSDLKPCVIDKALVTTIYTAKLEDVINQQFDVDSILEQSKQQSNEETNKVNNCTTRALTLP